MDILKDIFSETLNREKKQITIGGVSHDCFLRRNNNTNITLYLPYSDLIRLGALIYLNDGIYLLYETITSENTTYRKYNAMKCNQSFKVMFGKGDLVEYQCYMENLSASLSSSVDGITIDSSMSFILSLDENSKRLKINQRFYCGFFGQAWKISDINYKDGCCYLYCKRDSTQPTDDMENGIANRWDFDEKPVTYKVKLSTNAMKLDVGKSADITFTVSKNDKALEASAVDVSKLIVRADNGNATYKVKDSSTITVEGASEGITTLTVGYKTSDEDTVISDSIKVTVKKAVAIGEIVVSPAYNHGTNFKLLIEDVQTFTCSIDGVANPQWNITLNPNGVSSDCYKSTIKDNTFTVEDLDQASNYLIYTISEGVSGKSTTYEIKLGGYL